MSGDTGSGPFVTWRGEDAQRESRRASVLILGLPYFGKMLARRLRERGWEAQYRAHPGRSPEGWARLAPAVARADILYLISSRIERGAPQDWMMRFRKKPVVIHWVGTDALEAVQAAARGPLSRRLVNGATHWVDAPWLADELAPLGIRAEYVALPIPIPSGEPPPLPAEFRVLLYLQEDPEYRQVFDVEALLRLPGALPQAQFTLVPSSAESLKGLIAGPWPQNLATPGYVRDMDALYRDTTVLVRLTTHDGMSFMANEALARARYVVWTFPLEGAIQASGFDAVFAALSGLFERHKAGTLGLNTAGRAATLAAFDPTRVLDELDRRLLALSKR